MTYSIVALDEATGAVGVAVQSKALAAGAGVTWAEPGVGAVATQAVRRRAYGPDALRLLRAGHPVTDVLARVTEADPAREHRQVGVVTIRGDSAAFTGAACIPWAGHRTSRGISVQGNLLAGPAVVNDLFEAARAGDGPFPERLIGALSAGEAAGGDRRGRQAAALLVVPAGRSGEEDVIDLRVDDDDEPIPRLGALLAHHRLLTERPTPGALEPMTSVLGAELRMLLGSLRAVPERVDEFAIRELMDPSSLEDWDSAPIGESRPMPDRWDAGWQDALVAWMITENLKSRLAAAGWIDPLVVAHLRSRAIR